MSTIIVDIDIEIKMKVSRIKHLESIFFNINDCNIFSSL